MSPEVEGSVRSLLCGFSCVLVQGKARGTRRVLGHLHHSVLLFGLPAWTITYAELAFFFPQKGLFLCLLWVFFFCWQTYRAVCAMEAPSLVSELVISSLVLCGSAATATN